MMWTLDEARPLINTLYKAVAGFGYHVVLGGGVMKKGSSEKDLDIYLLPLNNTIPDDLEGVKEFLAKFLGESEEIGARYGAPHPAYMNRLKFTAIPFLPEKRIDLFIIGAKK